LKLAQTQTTGRIAGTVKDQNGALIVGAEVELVSEDTGLRRDTVTNQEGNYSVPFLPTSRYRFSISASGFSPMTILTSVAITETTTLDVVLKIAGPKVDENFIPDTPPFVQTDGPQLGRTVDGRAVSELPLATRNFTQI